MGAGILEYDVTFSADLELVCSHAQNDEYPCVTIGVDLHDVFYVSEWCDKRHCRMPHIGNQSGLIPEADAQDGRS